MNPPDAPYPEGIPPDITPIDALINRLGDEARQQGEILLDSAETRAARLLRETESRAENALFLALAAAVGAWLLLRK